MHKRRRTFPRRNEAGFWWSAIAIAEINRQKPKQLLLRSSQRKIEKIPLRGLLRVLLEMRPIASA
jgi:hypothetical protein